MSADIPAALSGILSYNAVSRAFTFATPSDNLATAGGAGVTSTTHTVTLKYTTTDFFRVAASPIS